MNEIQEVNLFPKKVTELNRTEKAAVIISALQKEGYNDNQISKFLEVSRARVCQVNKKIKKGTLNPLVNKAKKAVKSLLEGQIVGSMREVRGSDVLTAAKMVLDRTDPITVKTENTSVHMTVDITAEDRSRYKKALGIIDAEFEVIEPVLITHEPKAITGAVGNSEEVQNPSEPSTSN